MEKEDCERRGKREVRGKRVKLINKNLFGKKIFVFLLLGIFLVLMTGGLKI